MITRKLRNELIRSALLMAAQAVVSRGGKPAKKLPTPSRPVRGADAVKAKIGNNICAARIAANLTQTELATKAGTTARSISAIERGKQNVKLVLLADIAKALGKALADLAAGT
jgi:DNA-binding XRE family transcriptional regulator